MNASTQSGTPCRHTAPLALWRVAEAFMHMLAALFGNPEDVAARDTLTRAAHALMASWLRCGEAMMRRLILMEAGAYAKAHARAARARRRPRARRLMQFTAERPEQWRVGLRYFANRKSGARARRSRATGPGFASAWPLAERYEALVRAFNDPAPFARRLARRLHAAPQRWREALRAPAQARHRIDRFEVFEAQCAETAARFFSSA